MADLLHELKSYILGEKRGGSWFPCLHPFFLYLLLTGLWSGGTDSAMLWVDNERWMPNRGGQFSHSFLSPTTLFPPTTPFSPVVDALGGGQEDGGLGVCICLSHRPVHEGVAGCCHEWLVHLFIPPSTPTPICLWHHLAGRGMADMNVSPPWLTAWIWTLWMSAASLSPVFGLVSGLKLSSLIESQSPVSFLSPPFGPTGSRRSRGVSSGKSTAGSGVGSSASYSSGLWEWWNIGNCCVYA